MPVHAFSEGGANELINATTDTEEETAVDLLHFLAFDSEFWCVTRLWQLTKLTLSSKNSWGTFKLYFNPLMVNTFKEISLLKNRIVCIGRKAEEKLILDYRFFSFSFQELRSRKVKGPSDEDFWLCFCSFNQAFFPSHLYPSDPSWKSLSFVLRYVCFTYVLFQYLCVSPWQY